MIVTNNLFGDIITDLGATFQGGLGMAASGNIHPGRTSMFEPVHGSAPKFAGKNIANPIGAIASAGADARNARPRGEAAAIDAAILKAVRENQVTPDIGGKLGTREAGDFIAGQIRDAPRARSPEHTDAELMGRCTSCRSRRPGREAGRAW